ncbi:hypothetical protein [Catenulispora acidiphila]|uniref:hypothetical protein n=1 Tax=Catenulispora acidiphila TaxID=304895 RepID=UPI00117C5EC5|nr:hypothetical protein [Catenulispora acidiphila]
MYDLYLRGPVVFEPGVLLRRRKGSRVCTHNVDRRALIARFADEISKVQQERYLRGGVTDSGELEWVVFEREKLLDLVNAELAKFSKSPVDMAAVMLIENSAVGHIDYTQKLAIRAAELVLSEGDPR